MSSSHRPMRHDEWGQRPCLACRRAFDANPAHYADADAGHDYDPGERRHAVRRMEDRIALVERRFRAVNG